MTTTDYTTTFAVPEPPEAVYAVINDVRRWWTGDIDGESTAVGDEFTYRYQDVHRSTQRVTQLIPGQRVAWHVTDGYLSFSSDQAEWTGTDMIFDISREGDQTRVRFTHAGLSPAAECYDSCSAAWSHYVGDSLKKAIGAHQ